MNHKDSIQSGIDKNIFDKIDWTNEPIYLSIAKPHSTFWDVFIASLISFAVGFLAARIMVP